MMENLIQSKEKQLYRNKYTKITEKGNTLIITFSGTISSKEYRETLSKFLEVASHKSTQRWLWNQEKMSIFPQDWEWTITDWLDMSIDKLGEKRKIAFIPSQSFYLKYEIQNFFKVLQQNHKSIQAEIFEDNIKAELWLHN